MLSHEPKNYALLAYDGTLLLRGVAFRSSRAEPFGEKFLRRAVGLLLLGDVPGVRTAYVETIAALRLRQLSTYDVSSRVRLSKSPEQYLATRDSRRELSYEALLAGGRPSWTIGERVRVYRTQSGQGCIAADPDSDTTGATGDRRDYDVEHYVGLLRDTFAARLARAFTPAGYAAVFADPEQPSLFASALGTVRTVLTASEPAPATVDPARNGDEHA